MITKERIEQDFKNKLISLYAKEVREASKLQQYTALGHVIKDYISQDWKNSKQQFSRHMVKQVYYFSLEFLTGKFLNVNLINLGIREQCMAALEELGISLRDLEEMELEQGLGNGGLGRLAACFMDSMSATCIPAIGMGIRYRYGLFRQKIVDGYQVELSDDWLKNEDVWEVRREDESVTVKFGGHVSVWGENGKYKITFTDYEHVRAVPYDTPIIGYHNHNVNALRLWKAEVIDDDTFDYSTFSRGDYAKSVEKKYNTEFISYALYPDDSNENGKRLRLRQEYFFVSAGCQSIVNKHKRMGLAVNRLHEYVAIQINDTHPAMAVAELMRILMDEEHIEWDEAWSITTQTVAYTNHTIMAEALEKWDVSLVKSVVPRVYMIIEEIDRRFRAELGARFPGNQQRVEEMAVIAGGKVRMAHLAIVGGYSVNGVAWLHTEILKNKELKNFYEIYPEKFNNKTNGITHRRWLISANPALAGFITEKIGNGWVSDTNQLEQLLSFADDEAVCARLAEIKHGNKVRLADYIRETCGVNVDANAIFNVQIKRLHAYKRQLLSILYAIVLYNELKQNPMLDIPPKVFIYGAKAYPSYRLAKATIKLINAVAEKVNNDISIQNKLKIVFLENYNVDLAEKIIPAADVSLQISTASKEASGTGNMKLMMNGAITLATMDGANVEISNAVGPDNIVIFGLTSDEVINHAKDYRAQDVIAGDPRLSLALSQLQNGFFGVPGNEFSEIIYDLINCNDQFFVLKDFDAFYKAEQKIDAFYRDTTRWRRASLINIAKSGIFSSDNTIRQYASEIWHVPPFEVHE